MKYLSVILFSILVGCGSSTGEPKSNASIEETNSGSDLNSDAHVQPDDGPGYCASTYEYLKLPNGQMIEVEVPGFCNKYWGDRGDPAPKVVDPEDLAAKQQDILPMK